MSEHATTSWTTFEEMEESLSHSVDLEVLGGKERGEYARELKPLKKLLQRCSLDQLSAPVVQIVGSKGKGSTAMMLECLLRANGLKTGLYQSPHLLDRRERILVNGQFVPDSIWLEWAFALWKDSQKAWEPLSRFELETAVALAVFKTMEVDVILLEAGLGGVMDATSAATSQMQLLTSIELEHTELLGTTLEEITLAKAGIMHSESSFLCGAIPDKAVRVVEQLAQERGARLYMVERLVELGQTSYHAGGVDFSFQWRPSRWKMSEPQSVSLSMYGSHLPLQTSLAVLAAQVICKELLQINFEERSLKELELLHKPGRLQILQSFPPIILDCAHTVDSIRIALEAFHHHFHQRPYCVMLALNNDKKAKEILWELARHTQSLLILPNPGSRSWEPLRFHSMARKMNSMDVSFLTDVSEGLERLKALCEPDKMGLVTGSATLAGRVLEMTQSPTCAEKEPVL